MNPPNNRVAAAILVCATLAAYLPALQGGFVWDDDAHISENLTLRSAAGLHDIWLQPGATMQHYPLTFTVWWAGYHLWGLNPLGYHLITLLLHIAVSLMLWRVLMMLSVPGAWIGAMIFALHPVNVMSVAWATELKNTLSGLLALASCWAYLRYTERTASRWKFYALSLVLFVLALFAKTAVGFLPATLLLVAWWKNDRVRAHDLLSVAPMIACALSTGVITLYVEHHSGRAVGPEFAIPYVDRVMISGRSFWFYLGKFLFPYPLTFIYERWTIDARQAIQWLYPLATAAFLAALYGMRHRIGKGAIVGALHFYIATSALIFVVVTYMTRYSFVADHWQYFGAMGAAAVAGAAVEIVASRSAAARRLAMQAATAALIVLGLLTFSRARAYHDLETFWRDTLAKNPAAWMAHNNFGASLFRDGRYGEAIEQLREGIRLKPDHPEAHDLLGSALVMSGRMDEALEQYREAARLGPDVVEIRTDLAQALFHSGFPEEALAEFERAQTTAPNDGAVQAQFGAVLALLGRYQEAIPHLENAVRLDPNSGDARNNLAAARQALAR